MSSLSIDASFSDFLAERDLEARVVRPEHQNLQGLELAVAQGGSDTITKYNIIKRLLRDESNFGLLRKLLDDWGFFILRNHNFRELDRRGTNTLHVKRSDGRALFFHEETQVQYVKGERERGAETKADQEVSCLHLPSDQKTPKSPTMLVRPDRKLAEFVDGFLSQAIQFEGQSAGIHAPEWEIVKNLVTECRDGVRASLKKTDFEPREAMFCMTRMAHDFEYKEPYKNLSWSVIDKLIGSHEPWYVNNVFEYHHTPGSTLMWADTSTAHGKRRVATGEKPDELDHVLHSIRFS